MNQTTKVVSESPWGKHETFHEYIVARGDELSQSLAMLMTESFRPDAAKSLRLYSASEAADFIGTSVPNLRKVLSEAEIKGFDGQPVDVFQDARGHRWYTAEQIDAVRMYFQAEARSPDKFLPGRRTRDDHLQVLTFMNFKGGSGKTTSAIHAAQGFALRGYRVLAIDLDPQATLTMHFGVRPEIDYAQGGTIYDALRYEKPVPISQVIKTETYFHNLDYVPSGIMLTEYETESALYLREAGYMPFYMRMGNALREVEDQYDIVVIDCPPQIGFLTLTALNTTTGIITTIQPSMYDVASMAQFLALMGNLVNAISEQGVEPPLDFMRYLITRYDNTDNNQQDITRFLRHQFGREVLKSEVLDSTLVTRAASEQRTIYEIEPRDQNRGTFKRAWSAFNAVQDELENMVQAAWKRGPIRGDL